jgi:hypothetical protein
MNLTLKMSKTKNPVFPYSHCNLLYHLLVYFNKRQPIFVSAQTKYLGLDAFSLIYTTFLWISKSCKLYLSNVFIYSCFFLYAEMLHLIISTLHCWARNSFFIPNIEWQFLSSIYVDTRKIEITLSVICKQFQYLLSQFFNTLFILTISETETKRTNPPGVYWQFYNILHAETPNKWYFMGYLWISIYLSLKKDL